MWMKVLREYMVDTSTEALSVVAEESLQILVQRIGLDTQGAGEVQASGKGSVG